MYMYVYSSYKSCKIWYLNCMQWNNRWHSGMDWAIGFTFRYVISQCIQEVNSWVQISTFQDGFLLQILRFTEVEVVVQLSCFWVRQTWGTIHISMSHSNCISAMITGIHMCFKKQDSQMSQIILRLVFSSIEINSTSSSCFMKHFRVIQGQQMNVNASLWDTDAHSMWQNDVYLPLKLRLTWTRPCGLLTKAPRGTTDTSSSIWWTVTASLLSSVTLVYKQEQVHHLRQNFRTAHLELVSAKKNNHKNLRSFGTNSWWIKTLVYCRNSWPRYCELKCICLQKLDNVSLAVLLSFFQCVCLILVPIPCLFWLSSKFHCVMVAWTCLLGEQWVDGHVFINCLQDNLTLNTDVG